MEYYPNFNFTKFLKSFSIFLYSDDDESTTSKLNNSTNLSGQPNNNGKNQLSLMMYVIGGRVGQVTVFNGPISLWKLDLTKTF